MAFDVEEVLKSEWGLDGDDLKTVLGVLKPRADKIEKGYLRQSDYSREMDKVNTLRKQYDDNNEKLNADLAEFATMTAGEQGEATKLRDRIEKAEAAQLRLTQKITRYAETNGIDVKEVLGDVEPVKKVEPVAFDDAPLREQIGGVASYMLRLQAKLPGIMREHKALTGQDLDVDAFIDGIQQDIAAGKTGNIDPVKRWEAAHQIPTKRTEAATKQRETEIAAAKEEGRMAGLSERALPGEPRTGEHAPVFKMGGESKLQRPQPSTRLQGAVSGLATGRYRPKIGAA
jgi:hypothetical protein